MTGAEALYQRARRAGIITDYVDAWQRPRSISPETLRLLLDAMPGADAGDSSAPLPPVWVTGGHRERSLTLPAGIVGAWTLTEESGKQHHGQTRAAPAVDDEALEPATTGRAHLLTLPMGVSDGYHRLTLCVKAARWECRVIVAPERCYEPPAIRAGQRLWGSTAQLYTLRSARNWGIGDFGDLAQMIAGTGRLGGAFVGVNPLHALYPALPDWASPYSPSSRRYLNIIYLDVGGLDDFLHSEQAQLWWREPETGRRLQALRANDQVDYAQVMTLKLTALRYAWAQFNRRAADDPERQSLVEFIAAGGDSLYQQATFDALHLEQVAHGCLSPGWRDWPAEYQQANSAALARFRRQHQDEIAFFSYLQWLAARQLDGCYRLSQRLGMPIGIYRDLAVGVGDGGVETWADPALYCLSASVGAPPDRFGPQGQNWQLPPQDPNVLRERGYQPFIDMLRANMRYCGALRLDHVMALMRLWWVPRGYGPEHGAYVRYPVADLLAVLALESQRQQCMIIGEDLGTVPEDIVEKLRAAGVYSYKVLFFERGQDQQFRAPAEYPPQAMTTLTTHDLATLSGFWQGADIDLAHRLGLYDDEQTWRRLLEERRLERQALLDALRRAGCLPAATPLRAEEVAMSPALNAAIHRFVAQSRSALLGLQPEDWLQMATPVNVPGTTDAYPNWRRKLTRDLETLFNDPEIIQLLTAVGRWRGRGGKGNVED
ncbi:4-alpha-glucanotransferase [Sodalis sp. (in: enterobacteria)]|uniref:4-alpha-glucanotransferase n=1 Tax=Sodalis sp. (in: enterobacteria) TaxID=1898979 RepID=UPI003F38AE6C